MTLAITAAASALAAYTCSKIWAPGTLASAAFTPVIVALAKEALQRPAQVVTRAVPVRGAVRSTAPDGGAAMPELSDPIPQQGEVRGASRSRRSRGWRAAVVTGLLGFLVCVVVFTVPELVAGHSASGGGRETTIFGGQDEPRLQAPTTTTTAPTKTTVIVPGETVTVPPADDPSPPVTTEPVDPHQTPAPGPAEPLPAPDPANPAPPPPPVQVPEVLP